MPLTCSDPALILSLVDELHCTHLLLPPLWRLVAEYARSFEGGSAFSPLFVVLSLIAHL
jgi:hypothetical protein